MAAVYMNVKTELPERVFDVFVEPFVCQKTPPCFGHCVLAVNDTGLELRSKDNKKTFITWPIVGIRRYGFVESGFQIEAGRHCESGEGLFFFITRDGDRLNEELRQRIDRMKVYRAN